MNSRVNNETLRLIQRSAALVALFAMAFVFVGRSNAQANASTVPAAKTEAAAATAAQRTGDSRGSKGIASGIKVHGHWTIDVRNPDGKLVRHEAFENQLVSGGDALIANLLNGVYSSGAWVFWLGGTNATQTPANDPSPCGATSFKISSGGNLEVDGTNFCSLYEENSAEVAGNCTNATTSSSSFCTLTRTPAVGQQILGTGNVGANLITLTSTFQAPSQTPSNAYIGGVATFQAACSNLPGTSGLETMSPSACFQSGAGVLYNFTATLVPTPVPVQAMQSVTVTVQFSFQ